jgi:nucleoside 2-deoxyribosyltransferase
MSYNRLKGSIIYLAGPIQYADDWGVTWRKQATAYLHSLGIGVIDPCDKPSDMAQEDADTQSWLDSLKKNADLMLDSNKPELANRYLDEYSNFLKEVVSVDLRFVDKSDALLVYINKDIYSCGTFHETSHAFLQRKPVVCFTAGKSITNIPGWLYGHGKYSMFYPSLNEALAYVRYIHEDKDIDTQNRWKFLDYDKIYGRKL